MNTDITTKYLNFINELIKLFPNKNDKLIHLHKSISNNTNQVNTILTKFVNSINSNPKYQKLFVNKNNKLFHKTDNNNITFLPSINIKKLLQSSNDTTREFIWNNAFDFYSSLSNNNSVIDTIKQNNNSNNNVGLKDIIKDLNSSIKSLTNNPDSFKDPVNLITQLTNHGMNLFNSKYKNVSADNLSMKDIFSEIKQVLKEDNNMNIPDIDLPDDFDPFTLLGKLVNGQDFTELFNGIDINNFNISDFFKNINNDAGNNKPLTDEQIIELEEFYKNNDINKLMEDIKKTNGNLMTQINGNLMTQINGNLMTQINNNQVNNQGDNNQVNNQGDNNQCDNNQGDNQVNNNIDN